MYRTSGGSRGGAGGPGPPLILGKMKLQKEEKPAGQATPPPRLYPSSSRSESATENEGRNPSLGTPM